MARRSHLVLSALVSALLLTACGGVEDAADDEQTRTTSPTAQDSASVSPSASPSPSSSSRSPSVSPTRSVSTPPSASPSVPHDESTPGSASWTTSAKSGRAAGQDRPHLLEAVRTGRHDTFHRVVFEFSQAAPAFYAEYTETLRQGGSGRKIGVDGEHVLLLVFRGMTPESHFASAPATSVVREVVTASVFEGDMRIGIGLDTSGAGRPGFRIDTFGDRVVVDFAHTR
jgi:hypothetical protein